MNRSTLLALAWAVAACTGADARSALNEPVIDTLAGGVVQVTNTGDETAADVRVVGELPTDSGEPETSELEFTFLAGQESAGGTMVFSQEPTESDLRLLPVSFQDP